MVNEFELYLMLKIFNLNKITKVFAKCEELSFKKVNFDCYKRVSWRKFCLKFQKPKKYEFKTYTSFNGLETKPSEQEEAKRQHMSG